MKRHRVYVGREIASEYEDGEGDKQEERVVNEH